MKENITPAAFAAAAAGDMANFIAASTPGGIERQEAEGQRKMVEACHLPRLINNDGVSWDDLAKHWGVSFAPVDRLFHSVKLPAGWKLVPTEHSMNSLLIDDHGRQRANVFYKAAFYDQRADITVVPRYQVEFFVVRAAEGVEPTESGYRLLDRATKTVIETVGTAEYRDWAAGDKLREQAGKRLAELYPHHQNPFAYWNE